MKPARRISWNSWERSEADKKADAAGKHGKEGSAKDKKADIALSKKLGVTLTGKSGHR
jgi:hypothetical protein